MLLVHRTCYSLFLQTATICPQHTCIILLHQTDTALTTQQTATTVWYSYDIIPVSGLKVQQAVTALWRFCVCRDPGSRFQFPARDLGVAIFRNCSRLGHKTYIFSDTQIYLTLNAWLNGSLGDNLVPRVLSPLHETLFSKTLAGYPLACFTRISRVFFSNFLLY